MWTDEAREAAAAARQGNGVAHQKEVDAASRGLFSDAHVESLRQAYSGIKSVDPSGESYGKLTGMLDRMSTPQLKQLSGAKINFVSGLARNRVFRRGG